MTERLVVESLAKGEKSLNDLHHDTAIAYGLLNNIIVQLQFKEVLSYEKGKYYLKKESFSNSSSQRESFQLELKELFMSLLNQYFEDDRTATLRVQKVWMNDSEEKIFHSYLINMEKFLSDLQKNQYHKASTLTTKDKKVVVWGHANYSQLIEQTLKAI